MKKSDLKLEIKKYITEILSEEDIDQKAGAVVMRKTTSPQDIKKITDKGIDVQLKETKNKTSILKKLRGE